MKVLELFGGIGACTQALKRLGIDVEIADYVEIDKYAVKSYNAINGTNFEPQDITKWDKDIDVDLIMHGSPCQDISLAGQQAGADEGSGTRSSLMYETIRIVNKLKPKYIIWENVKNLISKKHRHNFDKYLEALSKQGYKNYWQVLNAKDYGIPQNRERVFTISIRNDFETDYDYTEQKFKHDFEFPPKQELKLKLKDLLENKVDEKYFLTESVIDYLENGKYNAQKVSNKLKKSDTGICPTLDTMQEGQRQPYVRSRQKQLFELMQKTIFEEGKVLNMDLYNQRVKENISQTLTEPHHNSQRLFDGYRIRKLTPKECWRLMGFSDEAFDKAQKVNSNTQLYKQAGNSIVVNVLEAIFKELLGG